MEIPYTVEARPDTGLYNGKLGVWLDSPMIDQLAGEGTVRREFPGKYILYKRFDIDISKQPMLIYPTLHYQNGGLEFQADGTTALPGLFVAGEVGGGIHGANRLMGNSLLDIIVFGRIAGKGAAEFALGNAQDGALNLDHVAAYNKEVIDAGVSDGRVAPALLPMYTDERIKERQLTTEYVGNIIKYYFAYRLVAERSIDQDAARWAAEG